MEVLKQLFDAVMRLMKIEFTLFEFTFSFFNIFVYIVIASALVLFIWELIDP